MFGVLMVVHRGSDHGLLGAAQCTWIATLDPEQVFYVTEYLPSKMKVGECGVRVPPQNIIYEESASDYTSAFVSAAKPTSY